MNLSVSRSLAVSLALCAMLLRALLPDGWMPNSGSDALVVCSMDGHHSGKTSDTKDQDRTHGPCAFAAAAHLAPPMAAFVRIGTTGEAVRLAGAFADDAISSTPQFRPNAARAPPAFA